MKRRTFQIVIFLLAVVPLGGCGLTPEQRITALEGAITRTQQVSQDLDGKIKLLQEAIRQAQATLNDPNVPGQATAYLREMLPKLEAKLAAVQPVKNLVDQQLAAFRAQLTALQAAGPVDVQGEFAAYGQGVATVGTAMPPPFNGIALLLGSVGLPLLGGILGAIAKGRRDHATMQEAETTNQNAVAGIVGSVAELLKKLPTPEQARTAVKDGGGLCGLPIIDQEIAKDILARAQVKVPEAAAAVRAALDGNAPMTFTARINA